MVAIHPQVLCLCLTVRAALSSLFQTMNHTAGHRNSLTSAPLRKLAYTQMSPYCLMLLPLSSAPIHQNSQVTQHALRTATDPIAVTADIVAAASGQGTALATAAQAIDLLIPQGTGMHPVPSLGLSPDHIMPALTDR